MWGRSPDAIQAKEAEQQRFIEEIERSLQEATRHDENYRLVFLKVAMDILKMLLQGHFSAKDTQDALLISALVWKPITLRTQDKTEQRYLLLKVFEKVFGSVATGIVSEYNAKELAEIRKTIPVE